MMQLFLFGTFWFWALIVTSVIVVIRLAETFEECCGRDEDTHEYWAGFVILLTLILLAIFGNWEFFKTILIWIQHNPFVFIGYLILYAIIGIIWSFFKWYGYLRKKRDYFRKWSGDKHKIPQFQDHISRIVSWMMYWPFSALWTLSYSLFRDVFNYLAEQLRGAYESIIKNMFKEFEKKEEK